MRAVFYGGRHFNNIQKLYEAFHTLAADRGMAEVYTTDEPGGPAYIADFAQEADLELHVVKAPWRTDGDHAEGRRRYILVHATPDLVVLLPGGREVAHMAALCQAAGLSVWDLRTLPFIRLGDDRQLGDSETPWRDVVF